LTDFVEGTLDDIYYRIDTMINNAIDFDEFKEFMETIGQSITKEDFNVKVLSEYCSTTQGLTLKGFKAYFKD
jgi:hypothetical protein